MVPSAVIAPLAAPFADRGRRERVLVRVSIVRGVATSAAAVVIGVVGPAQIIYRWRCCLRSRLRFFVLPIRRCSPRCAAPDMSWPAPTWCVACSTRSPRWWALLAAVLLQFTGVTVVFAVASGASLWAAVLMLRVRYDAPPRPSAPKGGLGCRPEPRLGAYPRPRRGSRPSPVGR